MDTNQTQSETIICRNCGREGSQQYCGHCGQQLDAHRISTTHLLHEVLHTFMHFEKGFLHTIRELALRPGIVQKRYQQGIRLHYQKPFPLFAISGTICALALYLIYRHAPNQTDQFFYKHYYFLVQSCMLPVYAAITFFMFRSRSLNFAEALVLNVYMVGFMAVFIVPINFFSLLLPNGIISLMEVIFLVGYSTWTFLNFFDDKKTGWVIVKSVISICACYLAFQYASRGVMFLFMQGE